MENQTQNQAENTTVVVKTPENGGLLAYLVNPGSRIDLSEINFAQSAMEIVDGNMHIVLPNGAGEIRLLDIQNAAAADESPLIIIDADNELPASTLLQALAAAEQQSATIEPAAGPEAAANNTNGGGFSQPTIEGDGFGDDSSVISDVIDQFSINASFDNIDEEETLLNQPAAAAAAVNNAPNAADDAVTTPEDVAVSFNVLTNDVDPEGDTLTVVGFTTPSNGTVVQTSNGVFQYTPNANYNGADSFTYTVDDGNGNQATATVNITVTPVNDAPDAVDDSATTAEDTAVNISVLTNDTDIDGDTLTVDSFTQGANGTVTFSSGVATYTPNANFNGTDTFTYTVTDGNGGFDTATVTVTVTPANDGPVANDDTATTDEDTSVNISVLTNDTDVDGDTLSVIGSTQPANGTVNLIAPGVFEYTPDANFNGTDTFTYTITDGTSTDTATVTVTVNPVNDGPVANDDTAATLEDTPITLDKASIISNDTDVEGDPLTITGINLITGNGTAVLNADESVTFTPDANFNGPVEIEYTISDGNGGTDTAVIHIQVKPDNDGPVANDDVATTPEDTPVLITNSVILANDVDPEGDPLTITDVIVTSGGGTATVTAGGVLYTPAANYNGPVVLEYTVTDGTDTTSAFINVTVTPVNDAPVAADDSITTPEDTPLTFTTSSLLANDVDVDGDTLSIVSFTQPTNGTVVDNLDGTYTFTPNANYNGADSFTYTITDGTVTDTATVTIDVTPVKDPDAVDDYATTAEDTPITLTEAVLTANDIDEEGNPLDVIAVSMVSGPGTATLNATGDVTYTPPADFNGTVELSYTIQDDEGRQDTASIFITVAPANDAPTANDDTAQMNEDAILVIPEGNLLANDTDPDGDALSVIAVSVVSGGGNAVVDAGGNVIYTPAANYNGPAVLEYTITDGNGGTDTALINITINPINDAPIANDDTAATLEDTPITLDKASIISNDSDVDGDPLTITSINLITGNGTAVLNADESVTFTPDANFNGPVEIEYTISDGNGGTDTAVIRIQVKPDNDGPVANDDTATTPEDTPILLTNASILANDTDPEGDTLTITDVIVTSGGGTATLTAAGIQYTPAANYNGPVVLEYTITDGTDTTSAFINIEVTPVNDAPVAADDSITTPEDTALTFTVDSLLANDSDVDGDTLSIVSFTQPTNGTVVDNLDGTYTFTPNANYNGTDSFTYTITDGTTTDTATVTIDVTPVKDPDAVDDYATTAEDTPITLTETLLTSNDIDEEGGVLEIIAVSMKSGPGTATLNATGDVTYTPPADFSGTVELSYTIRDDEGREDTASIFITVSPANDAPIANDDTASMNEDAILVIPEGNLLANDTDPDGDALNVIAVSVVSGGGNAVVDAGGNVIYTPAANYNGAAVLEYTIADGNGGTDTALINITIHPINDAPIANDDTAATLEDTPITLDKASIISNDSDVDGDPLTITGINLITGNGTAVLNADQSVTFTPAADFNGPVEIEYTISDGNGGTDTAVIRIQVKPDNDGPTANDDVATTPEDTPVLITNAVILANDTDPEGDTLTITNVIVTSGGGTATLTAGGVLYTPAADYNGPVLLEYTVTDGTDVTSAFINVTVTPVNDAPVAGDDNITTPEDTPLTFTTSSLLANDVDVDGDTLSIVSFTQPTNGTIVDNLDGTYTFTPNANYNGTDSFTYTITDGTVTDTATVSINVTPVKDPDAVDDYATTNEDTPITLTEALLTSNDIDEEGGALDIIAVSMQSGPGTATLNAAGDVTYTPPADFSGTVELSYTIQDSEGGQDTATIFITVLPANDAPIANDDTAQMNEDAILVIPEGNLLANDSDPDGDPISVVAVSVVSGGGSAIVDAGGNVIYTPAANYNGPAVLEYTISDGNGGTDTALINITINPINDAPDAVDDSLVTNEDTAASVSVLTNDTDVDGDTLTVTGFTQPTHGVVVQTSNGIFQYTPDANYNGTDTFTYTVSDGNGGTDTATVNITVTPVNDDPNAVDDSGTTNENTSVNVNVLTNDTDVDGDTLTVSSFTQGSNGTVTFSGGVATYNPNAGFSGTDTFTYTVSDGNGGTDTATVTIDVVAAPNEEPIACDDSARTTRGNSVNINVLANDSDPDGDTLTVTGFTQPNNGTVTFSGGVATYNPTGNFVGSDSFTYTITDGNGGFDTATVYITVRAPSGWTWDCPLAFDLGNDGLVLMNGEESSARFDLNGDGFAEETAWFGSEEGILAIDRDGNGEINGVDEVFGNKEIDGFTELAQREDSNNDGVIDANDENFGELRVWVDSDGDGQSDEGELFLLADVGIESINVGGAEFVDTINNGQWISHEGTYTKTDGSTGTASSVWFEKSDVSTQLDSAVKVDLTNGEEDIIQLSDVIADNANQDVIIIQGDAGDNVEIAADFSQTGAIDYNGASYAVFSNGQTQTLVDVNINVNGESLA